MVWKGWETAAEGSEGAVETREAAQQFGALSALSEDPGLIPSTHVLAHNCLQLQFHGF